MKIDLNDYIVNYKILNDEILEQVGLSTKPENVKILRFYLEFAFGQAIYKWVADTEGIDVFQAKTRIINYHLLDHGNRICKGETKEIRLQEFNCLQKNLDGLELEQFYTTEELMTLLNEIGFNFSIDELKN